MTVNVVWHPSSLDHDPGPGHPEGADRLRAVLDALRTAPLAERVCWHEAAPASDAV